MNSLESFILEQEHLVSKAAPRDADGEPHVSLGARWDAESCTCSKRKFESVVQNQGKKHVNTNTHRKRLTLSGEPKCSRTQTIFRHHNYLNV